MFHQDCLHGEKCVADLAQGVMCVVYVFHVPFPNRPDRFPEQALALEGGDRGFGRSALRYGHFQVAGPSHYLPVGVLDLPLDSVLHICWQICGILPCRAGAAL